MRVQAIGIRKMVDQQWRPVEHHYNRIIDSIKIVFVFNGVGKAESANKEDNDHQKKTKKEGRTI